MNILEISISADIILIQPSTLFKRRDVDLDVIDYFKNMNVIGSLTGDSPVEPNYGLLTLASRIKEIGFTVSILDFNEIDYHLRNIDRQLNDSIVESILKKCTARIIGISYMTSAFGNWERIIYNYIRNMDHLCSIPIVYGGIHPSIYYEQILELNKSDDNLYVMVGEGDVEFPLFCENILLGKHHDVNGVAGYSNSPAKQLVNSDLLHAYSRPDYSILPQYSTCNARRYYLTRGCTSRCSFCSVSHFHSQCDDKYYRQLCDKVNGGVFFPQIDELLSDFESGNEIIIGDLTFFETEWYYKEFCSQLAERQSQLGVNLKWWCQTRADSINLSMLEHMKSAGCNQIAVGCESASNYILDKLRKNITVDEWKRSLSQIKEKDISTQAYIIIGSGFETKESVEETIFTVSEMMGQGLIDLVHVSVIAPFPGTELYKAPTKYGINIKNDNFSEYWMNCDLYGYGHPVYETITPDGNTSLTSTEIYDYWKLALKEFGKIYQKKARSI